jgi:hypothetical protein
MLAEAAEGEEPEKQTSRYGALRSTVEPFSPQAIGLNIVRIDFTNLSSIFKSE